MKINKLTKVGERTEQYEVTIPAEYDAEGNEVSSERTEIRTRIVPIMQAMNVDETPEEAAQREAQETELRKQEEEAFWALPYGERAERLIRERYSLSDELALSRQRETKAEEFAEYFQFCEDCKAKAKERS